MYFRSGAWKDITLKSIRATDKTRINILSQNDKILEYRSDVTPKTTWKQEPDGLHIRAMRAQRLYDNRKWPNPVVLKLTQVEPALTPPRVETRQGKWDAAAKTAVLEGALLDLGNASSVEIGFEYRPITGQDVNERTEAWRSTLLQPRSAPADFSMQAKNWKPGEAYEFRAVVKHPLLMLYGKEINLRVP